MIHLTINPAYCNGLYFVFRPDLFVEREVFDAHVSQLLADLESSTSATNSAFRFPGEESQRRKAEILSRSFLELVEDDPAPHRFAQGVARVFLLASTLVLFLSHAMLLGWALDLVVFLLSSINLFVGFCAGCFVYYHLSRLGITPRVRYAGGFHWRGV